MFLRRSKADNIRLEDLFIGSSLNVLARQLKVVDYGDDFTARKLSTKTERLVIMHFKNAREKSLNFSCAKVWQLC